MDSRPLFSIIHPTARPDKWRAIYDAWLAAAVQPQSVEYVLVVDERWGFGSPLHDVKPSVRPFRDYWPDERYPASNQWVWNTGRRCYVDSVNVGAAAATGRILIVVADDQHPAPGWDRHLLVALARQQWRRQYELDSAAPDAPMLLDAAGALAEAREFVIEVSTGTPEEHERGIFVMPIVSRARYVRLGYLFWPEYESMYADNDLCEHARLDGVVIDARGPMFPHRHFLNDTAVAVDDAYRAQNRREAYAVGQQVLGRRRATSFGAMVDAPGRTLALCLTGEHFGGAYVDALLTLYNHLTIRLGFEVVRARNYTTNVYVTRAEIWATLAEMNPRPDFLLWIDDDNTATPDQFDALLAALEARPEVDVMAAWCWAHDQNQVAFQVSCGSWAPDGVHWQPLDPLAWPKKTEPELIEVTGFPFILMRSGLVDKLGPLPFIRGILDQRLTYGIGGEDLAFCRACREAGVLLAAHPAVRVRHLKTMEVIPEFTYQRSTEAVKIAVMMRVRNEARWIRRVVESVKMLGPVYVMDDASTDDTVDIAYRAGASVLLSPFNHDDLDEARDKNWLMDRVAAQTGCEWLLCIDGDEELERGGAEKVRRACRAGAAEVYSVKFLHLWDRPDQARVDRWYSDFHRLSLFRVMPNVRFRSLYEGRGVNSHSGLHTGNAPLPDGRTPGVGLLNVYLLHYGCMLRADRVRKYAYYNRIDPNNQMEDCYRHVAQGDLPEVPASMVLRHAGPLDVRTLPASIAPDWPEWEGWVNQYASAS